MHRQHKSNRSNRITIRGKINSQKQSIRQRYIQSTIKSMRQQLLVAYNEDYLLLKNINLPECFDTINSIQDIKSDYKLLDRAILNMFAYCVTENSSHMYSLMSDFTLEKLIKMVSWQNIGQFEVIPKIYIRIHRIIANFCNYACGAPPIYFDVVGQLLKHILKQLNFYNQSLGYLFFTHVQAKELISILFYGLGEINFGNIGNLDFVTENFQDLMKIVLEETDKVFRYLQKHSYDQNHKATTIILACYNTFNNILTLDISNQVDNQQGSSYFEKLKIIELLDREIVNKLLLILKSVRSHNMQHQYLIARCLNSYFQTNLLQKPQILLKHDFRVIMECVKDAAFKVKKYHDQIANYDKRLQIEGETNVSMAHLGLIVKDHEKVLSRWLGILVIVFGVNLQDDQIDVQQVNTVENGQRIKIEQAYYELWTDWLQNYIIPAFKQLLKIANLKSKEITLKIMNILENICLDQALCQILLEQNELSNFIFYNCISQQVKIDIKRCSLMCLVNMLRAAYGDNLKKILLSEAKKYDFPTIFADSVGAYSSPELNQKILEGLYKLLQLDLCQNKNNNWFWRLFCEADGKRQLEKLLEFKDQKWQNTVKFAEGILYQYDIHEV